MKSTCTVGAVSIALVCLSAAPAVADFKIYGGASGYNLATVTSDVASPASFSVTGTSPSDDTDVEFHLHGTYSDTWLDWTNDLYFRADISTGEIGVAMLSHTNAPGPARTGPYSNIDVSMYDTYHIEPGGGFGTGDPVEIDFLASWIGHVLLEGSPSGGSFVRYLAQLYLGGTLLAELDSVDSGLYPYENFAVNRSARQRVAVHVGDTLTFKYWISLDLNASAYAGNSGDNDLDFLDTGTGWIEYAPGYEDLNIWSDAGAAIVPEPATLSLLGLATVMLVHRRRGRKVR